MPDIRTVKVQNPGTFFKSGHGQKNYYIAETVIFFSVHFLLILSPFLEKCEHQWFQMAKDIQNQVTKPSSSKRNSVT